MGKYLVVHVDHLSHVSSSLFQNMLSGLADDSKKKMVTRVE
jgi:hypothetical protein